MTAPKIEEMALDDAQIRALMQAWTWLTTGIQEIAAAAETGNVNRTMALINLVAVNPCLDKDLAIVNAIADQLVPRLFHLTGEQMRAHTRGQLGKAADEIEREVELEDARDRASGGLSN